LNLAVVPIIAVTMAKRKAPMKASSAKKKASQTKKTANPQPVRAPQPTPPIPILDLVDDDDPIFLEDNVTVAVDKDPSPSPQYTVSHTVYLDEKVVDEDSKVYQLDEGIKNQSPFSSQSGLGVESVPPGVVTKCFTAVGCKTLRMMSSASVTSLTGILSLSWHNGDALRISATLATSMDAFHRSR